MKRQAILENNQEEHEETFKLKSRRKVSPKVD